MSRISLSRLEYDICWESLQLGEFPTVLTMNSHGFTMDERRQLAQQAWVSLRRKGLVDGSGDLDPDLAEALATLARPEWEVDARLRAEEQPMLRAMVACSRDFAVRAMLDSENLVLERIPSSALVWSLIELLPAHTPGKGRSVTLPAATLDRAAAKSGEDAQRFKLALVDEGLPMADAARIADLVGDVQRMGQFGAAHTPRRNVLTIRRQRASHAVAFYDTSTGRYQFSRRPSPDGQQWSTLAPADNRTLAHHVQGLLSELSA